MPLYIQLAAADRLAGPFGVVLLYLCLAGRHLQRHP